MGDIYIYILYFIDDLIIKIILLYDEKFVDTNTYHLCDVNSN